MTDLGRVVSVHRRAWQPYAIAALACTALLVKILASFGLVELGFPLVIFAFTPIWLVQFATRAWRTRVEVHERGFTWVHDGVRDVVRWVDIVGVDPAPGRGFALAVTVYGMFSPILLPRQLYALGELAEAIAQRRPTPPTMPEARLLRP